MAFEEKEEAKAPPCGLYGRRGGSGMRLRLCGSVWPRAHEGQPANQRKGSWRKRRGVRRGGQALQLCQVARGSWVPVHRSRPGRIGGNRWKEIGERCFSHKSED